MTLDEAVEKYGPINDFKWPRESEFMVILDIQGIDLPWLNENGSEQKHIYCNKDLAPVLIAFFTLLKERGCDHELKTFNGCFMIRSVRGEPGAVSAHSYGLAIDVNAKENPLGGPVKLSDDFLQCARDVGLTCGADFHRVDGMHFSAGW